MSSFRLRYQAQHMNHLQYWWTRWDRFIKSVALLFKVTHGVWYKICYFNCFNILMYLIGTSAIASRFRSVVVVDNRLKKLRLTANVFSLFYQHLSFIRFVSSSWLQCVPPSYTFHYTLFCFWARSEGCDSKHTSFHGTLNLVSDASVNVNVS